MYPIKKYNWLSVSILKIMCFTNFMSGISDYLLILAININNRFVAIIKSSKIIEKLMSHRYEMLFRVRPSIQCLTVSHVYQFVFQVPTLLIKEIDRAQGIKKVHPLSLKEEIISNSLKVDTNTSQLIRSSTLSSPKKTSFQKVADI